MMLVRPLYEQFQDDLQVDRAVSAPRPPPCTSVMTYMGKESKREPISIYVELSHFAVHLKLTILQINYTPIKIFKNIQCKHTGAYTLTSSCPLILSWKGWPVDSSLLQPLPWLPISEIKQTFPSTNLVSRVLIFEW